MKNYIFFDLKVGYWVTYCVSCHMQYRGNSLTLKEDNQSRDINMVQCYANVLQYSIPLYMQNISYSKRYSILLLYYLPFIAATFTGSSGWRLFRFLIFIPCPQDSASSSVVNSILMIPFRRNMADEVGSFFIAACSKAKSAIAST